MENQEQKSKGSVPQRVHQNLKSIHHFSYEIPLPPTAQIYAYTAKFGDSKKKKKIKHKFQSFTYYQENDSKQACKILFLTDDKYVDQGKFPFTQPQGKICNFSEFSGKRMKVTQAAYIGHTNDELIIKKIEGVKLGQNGSQFQTVDDKFQVIKIGNQNRFNQFLKLLGPNKNSINMSIRVIIDETEGKNPEVLDYQFFYRQKELIKKNSGALKA